MFKTVKTYTPPRVLQETEVQLERDFLGGSVVENQLERDFLGGSVVENLNEAGVFTMSQEVEEIDMETENFNFKWE